MVKRFFVFATLVAIVTTNAMAAPSNAPRWLPSHTHNGIECILAIRGTTMWWFHGGWGLGAEGKQRKLALRQHL